MRTILLPVGDDPTISFAFSFGVGSQDDPPGKPGLAALTGAMLVEGATTNHSYEEILAQLYPLATGYDVTVDKEQTTITGRVHRDKLDPYLALLLDAVLRPAFLRDDFERLKSDAINFIANTLRFASDEELGKAALHASAYAATPYAHPVTGTLSGLAAISLDDVRAFYEQYFVRSRLTLGVAGGCELDLITRIEAALDTLAEVTPADPPRIEPVRRTGRHLVLVDKPGADASISFGFPLAVKRGERDFYALAVANSHLGQHRNASSHLYQVIREARGLNYGDYSYIEAFPLGGMRQMPPVNVARRRQLFEVWIRTLPNDQAVFALRAALRELEQLVAHGLSAAQFELRRRFLQKYCSHYASTTAAQLGYAIDDAFYGIAGDGHLASFREHMRELTLEEVNAAIERHWQTADLTIAIVTGDADGLAERIASGAATPINYPTPKPATVLAEDEAIASYPLAIDAGNIERWPVDQIFA